MRKLLASLLVLVTATVIAVALSPSAPEHVAAPQVTACQFDKTGLGDCSY